VNSDVAFDIACSGLDDDLITPLISFVYAVGSTNLPAATAFGNKKELLGLI
jgi:hypothetical protein